MPRSIRSIAPPPPILAALIVALAALAWRVLYLTRLEGTVLAGLLEADSRVYWDWSRRILQAGWVGDHPFFFGPLYPYSLAAAAALGLRTLEGVRVLQSLVSTGTILLLTVTACRLHGVPWGLFCGLLCAGYSMWVFFDRQVLTESLLLALRLLLLALPVVAGGKDYLAPDAFLPIVIRDDEDRLLAVPYAVSMITAPAVNAGAVLANEPHRVSQIEPVMLGRIEKLLSVVSAGAAGSWMLSNVAPRMLRRDFEPGFRISLQQKDLRLQAWFQPVQGLRLLRH